MPSLRTSVLRSLRNPDDSVAERSTRSPRGNPVWRSAKRCTAFWYRVDLSKPVEGAQNTFPFGSLARSRSTVRSEEHTSQLQSLMRISYAVFCLKKKKKKKTN